MSLLFVRSSEGYSWLLHAQTDRPCRVHDCGAGHRRDPGACAGRAVAERCSGAAGRYRWGVRADPGAGSWTPATAPVVTTTANSGARYYNPTTARFTTQPDPAGQEPNPNPNPNPQPQPPSPYTGDNPTNNTDPGGLFSITNFLGGVGTGLVAVGAGLTAVGTAELCVTVIGCAVPISAAGTSIASAGASIAFFNSAF